MAAAALSGGPSEAEHRFYTGMAIAIFVAVFVGFSRSFFLRPLFPTWHSPSEAIFYVHGTAFASWTVLLIGQASLVRAGRVDLHRKVGPYGAVPMPPLRFLAIPLFDMLVFPLFVSLAIAQRRVAQSHKRWMRLATISLIAAAVARWPVVIDFNGPVFFAVADLFLVPLVVWDLRSRGRLHPATLWGSLLLIASQPLRLLVSGTDSWQAFARWATGLLG